MSGNSCESALQTAPIVSDLPPGGAGRRLGGQRLLRLGGRGGGGIGFALGHGLAHRAR